MKLIEYKAKERIFENEKIVEILKDSFIIEQFYSENYDRYYDVFKLSSNNSSIILKKTFDKDEIDLYNILNKNNIKCTYNKFMLEYQCAKLNNYLRIIYAFKTRKWDRTEWYNKILNNKEISKLNICLFYNVNKLIFTHLYISIDYKYTFSI